MSARHRTAEHALTKLSRIVGGILLSNGPLAHQVLGQLLILNQKDVEIAAASVLVSAVSGQRNAAIAGLVRVLAPATALHFLTQRDGARWRTQWEDLERREESVQRRELSLARRERRAGG